jgi:hypothetical protein
MGLVTEILTYDQLHDLWGAGYTIVRRPVDRYEVDQKLVPAGKVYQWNPVKSDGLDVKQPEGWTPVPYSRHEGVFAPWGMPGNIEFGGLALCEKDKEQAEEFHRASHAKAHQNVEDWLNKTGASFSGGVTVGADTKVVGDKDLARKISGIEISEDGEMAQVGATKTIETIVRIPGDMTPHIAAIFAERDRLEAEVVRKDRTLVPGPIADKFYEAIDANKGAPWWPTLRAILLPIAVDNVRASLKKEPTDE